MKKNKGLSSQKITIVIAIIGILLATSYIVKVFYINDNSEEIKVVTQEHKEITQDKEESEEEKIDRLSKVWAEIRNNRETDVMKKVLGYAVTYDDHSTTELLKIRGDELEAKRSESVKFLEESLDSYDSFITRYKDKLLQKVAEYIEKNKENTGDSDIDISYFEMFYEKYKNK